MSLFHPLTLMLSLCLFLAPLSLVSTAFCSSAFAFLFVVCLFVLTLCRLCFLVPPFLPFYPIAGCHREPSPASSTRLRLCRLPTCLVPHIKRQRRRATPLALTVTLLAASSLSGVALIIFLPSTSTCRAAKLIYLLPIPVVGSWFPV